MLVKEIENGAIIEINEDKTRFPLSTIKERLTEIKQAEIILKKLKKSYQEFLKKDVDDVYDESLIR